MNDASFQASNLFVLFTAITQLLLVSGGAYMYFRWLRQRRLNDRLVQEKEVIFGFVHDVGEVFAEAEEIEPDLLLKRVLFYALRTTRASAGAIYLVDRETEALHARAVSGVFPPLHQVVRRETEGPVSRSRHVETLVKTAPFAPGEGLVGRVADTGSPILIADADSDALVPRHEIDFLRIQSIILVPMRFHQKVLGVVTVVNRIDGKPFVQADLNLLQALADQASAAVYYAGLRDTLDEKRRIDTDLSLARQIQASLLPRHLPEVSGIDLAAFNEPAQQIGGDYYDVLQIDQDHLGIAIADVSGKSIAGAMLMSVCRSVLRAQSPSSLSPAEVLKAINRVMSPDISEDMFVTMLYIVVHLDSHEITVARAGHERPILVRRGETNVTVVDSPGTAIGMTDDETFETLLGEVTLPFEPGDILVAFTDGINEAMNGRGEEWGMERFYEACRSTSSQGPHTLIGNVRERLSRFVGATPQYDDMTLLAIQPTDGYTPEAT